ncbi:IPT/TIG domain-containing protein [Mucilaginibacter sp. PAMB04168]|uniref:IPT/TIG domain-containing protein n=1 Tax=Mucilaginibacter sp. PAMB04168 TaxID=3138567 RepID=UPI0031F6CC0F
MKIVFFAALICLFTLALPRTYAQSWQPLGPNETEQLYPGASGHMDMKLKEGIPYVAMSINKGVVVRRPIAAGREWEQVGNYVVNTQFESPTLINIEINKDIIYVAYVNIGTVYIKKLLPGASVWETVGADALPSGQIGHLSMVFNDDVPYVIFQNALAGTKLTVMRLNAAGTGWENVGNASFTQGKAYYPSLAFYNHVPYVAYEDVGISTRVMLMRLNATGTNWETLASTETNVGSVNFTSLAFKGSIPCVAYANGNQASKATVIQYNVASKAFEPLGQSNFSQGAASEIVLKENGGTVYIAYTDLSQDSKLTVMKLSPNATNWTLAGNAAFTAGNTDQISLEFAGNKPVLTYRDYGFLNRAKIAQLNDSGTKWELASTSGFTPGSARSMKLVNDGTRPYLAYTDQSNNQRLAVRRYNKTSGSWESAGPAVISTNAVSNMDIAMNGTQAYVVYGNGAAGNKATVKKLNAAGDNWETVGSPGFSGAVTPDAKIALAFNGTTPYIAHADYNNSGKGTVMRLNDAGTTWQVVGKPNFTTVQAKDMAMAIEQGTPYIAYYDKSTSKAIITRLNTAGTDWETVAEVPFNTGEVVTVSALVFNQSAMYLLCRRSSYLALYQFNAAKTTWTPVGKNAITGYISADDEAITFLGTTPYISYINDLGDKQYVVRPNLAGTDWETVGPSTGISETAILNTALTSIGDELIVAYESGGAFAQSFKVSAAITAAQPLSAGTGKTVTLTGRNFTGATAVSFGGTPAASFKVVSPTTITAVTGSGASGDIQVISPAGTAIFSGFEFVPAPGITSFSPTSGASGTKVTLTGSNFTNASQVTLGGYPVASFSVESPTSITAVASDKGGTGSFVVTTPGGTAISQRLFIYSYPPTVTAANLMSAKTGATVTLTGTNLSTVTAVSFGGVPAASFKIVSATSLTAVVGEGASGEISVTSPGGIAVLASFTYLSEKPTITSLSESKGSYGTTISIKGANFTGTNTVSFGGTAVQSYTVVSPELITAVLGNGANGEVKVITPKGTAILDGFTFIAAPVIQSFTPVTAAAGTPVTINGLNFSGATTVQFGGIAAASYQVVSPEKITAVIGTGKTGEVTVSTPLGQASLKGFVFLDAPVISSFTPANAKKGTVVTITGTNLRSTTAVTFGGRTAASFQALSETSLTAVVGEGASGAVEVSSPTGKASALGFTYIQPPGITSFSPASAGAGALVTLTGTNFLGTTGIQFGGVPVASFTVNSSTSITATVGSGGTGSVNVITPGGEAVLSGFRFIPQPVIQSFTPSNAKSGETVSIVGTNLEGATVVAFGGTPAAFYNVVSSTLITATVANGGSGTISLRTPGGSATKDGFIFNPPPRVVSFSPKTAGPGSQVLISGENFTGATEVSLGGIPAASFRIISSTAISVQVPPTSLNNGAVRVTTSYGSGVTDGFRYIPQPVLTPDGPTTFVKGGKVTLRASDGQGYVYQWYRDGIAIAGQNSTAYTVTESGTYMAKLTVDGYSTQTEPVQVEAQYVLPASNFRVSATSASCKGQANGAIDVTAEQPLRYTATLTGKGLNRTYPFSQQLTIPALGAGSYNVCITVAGEAGYQQCFELKVTEPKDLAVYTLFNRENNTVSIDLQGGTEYALTLNGAVYHTSGNRISLPLSRGSNRLLVSTNQPCQGTVERMLNYSGNQTPYPNPVERTLYVNLGEVNVPSSEIRIYSTTNGRLVWSSRYVNASGVVELDLSAVIPGIYSMQLLQGKEMAAFKIVKK